MRVIKWEPFRDVDDMFDRFVAETDAPLAAAGAGPGASGGNCSRPVNGRLRPT